MTATTRLAIPAQSNPVDLSSGQPQLGHSRQHTGPLGIVFRSIGQGRNRNLVLGIGSMLSRQSCQSPARPQLDQDSIGVSVVVLITPHFQNRIGKPHRLSQMLRPVLRVGRLLVTHPITRNGREDRNLGRRQFELADELCKRIDDLVHHRRVESVRSMQVATYDLLRFEFGLEFCDLIIWPGHDTQARSVVRTDRHIAPQHRLDFGACEANTHHAAARQSLHCATSFGDHFQTVFQRENACGTRRSKFADRMAHQCFWPNAPSQPDLGQRISEREQCRLCELSVA